MSVASLGILLSLSEYSLVTAAYVSMLVVANTGMFVLLVMRRKVVAAP
jgi:hypothetical protein